MHVLSSRVAVLAASAIALTACGAQLRLNAAPPSTATATTVAATSGAPTTTALPAAAPTATDSPTTLPPTAAPTTTESPTTVPPTTAPAVRPTTAIDELVPVGAAGARLHIRCTGDGPETVVLIAGFGDGGESWDAIMPGLAEHVRSCAYARYGTGTSDPPATDQTFATEADDLHALLQAVGEPGPYVLVGHSFGGAEAATFADRYRAEVDGLLLLDASPVGWPDAVCAVPDDGSAATADYRLACDWVADASANPERLDAATAFAEAGTIDSLGDLPTIVATAAVHARPGLDQATVAALDEVWDAGQQRWASLSTNAELVPVPDTGHYIQLDQPELVSGWIHQLVAG